MAHRATACWIVGIGLACLSCVSVFAAPLAAISLIKGGGSSLFHSVTIRTAIQPARRAYRAAIWDLLPDGFSTLLVRTPPGIHCNFGSGLHRNSTFST